MRGRLRIFVLGLSIAAAMALAFRQFSLVARIRGMDQDVRQRYHNWQNARAEKRVEKLLSNADIVLRGDGSEMFERLKPSKSGVVSVEHFGPGEISTLLPPETVCPRKLVVVEIPGTWFYAPGSTNRTFEEYILDTSDTLKARGFRKVAFVAPGWGFLWEVQQPSRRRVEAIRRGAPLGQ
jgi:hypothetical protein